MSILFRSCWNNLKLSSRSHQPSQFIQRVSFNKNANVEASSSNFASEVDLDEIRKEFTKFEGGRVLLSKNEETGTAFICLDHVEKKNGLSGKMMVDLNDAVKSLEEWSTGKALILHSRGDTFCSGGYLETVKNICNPRDGFKMSSLMQDSVIRLSQLPLVSVSVVQGKALGGGAELMLATDFRLFTPTTQCRFVEANMGVGTGWGGGIFLRKLVGRSMALNLLLSCRKISAKEGISIGLVDDIIQGESLLEEAVKWIKNLIGTHDYSVVQTVKQIVSCNNFEDEKRFFARTWGGPAQLKALSSNLKHK